MILMMLISSVYYFGYMNECNIKDKTIFCRDNIDVLQGINDNCIDLIYLDPPFNKKKVFTAPIGTTAEGASFRDIWKEKDIKDHWIWDFSSTNYQLARFISSINNPKNKENYNYCYLVYMAKRLVECHRILKDTGGLYLHCDPTMSHYLKIVLDKIFGESNFRNEIVWHYGLGGSSNNAYSKKHDTILFYTVSNNYCFNKPLVPATSIKMKGSMKGMTDVWDIPTINNMAKERTGYPTQKPLALLDRIIKASSNEGDIVLDPFCGCATTCVSAENLGRKWIGIDVSEKAYQLVATRLAQQNPEIFGAWTGEIHHRTDIPKRTDIQIEKIPKYNSAGNKRLLYRNQDERCVICQTIFPMRNLTVDHKQPVSRGGSDHISNLQLLCQACNSMKGNRTQEWAYAQYQKQLKDARLVGV